MRLNNQNGDKIIKNYSLRLSDKILKLQQDVTNEVIYFQLELHYVFLNYSLFKDLDDLKEATFTRILNDS